MSKLPDVPEPSSEAEDATPAVRLPVEYWTVTMEQQSSCGSCDQALATVNNAVDAVRPLAGRLGIAIDVVPRAVATWSEAVDHGIVASPTIRAAGIELRPSHPDDSERRLWEWRGAAAASPAPEAVLDFLVQALSARSKQLSRYLSSGGPASYVRRFLRPTQTLHDTPTPKASAAPGGCGGCLTDAAESRW